MRPIPPPPPTPPPGVVYVPQMVYTNGGAMVAAPAPQAAAPAPATPVVSPSGQPLEVSSNFVSSAPAPGQTVPPGSPGAPGGAVAAAPQTQYEVVPPRPGPDYIWRDGYWRWENAWVWVPGQWVFEGPEVIIVPGGYYHHGYGWRYGRRYRW